MYKYILFDLDGTLTDPGIGITNSVMYALEKFGIEVDNRASLYKFIGPPLLDSFQKYYGLSKEESELAIKYYREYFKPKGLYENEVYEGIETLLQELKKREKKLLVATSKPEEFAVEILKHYQSMEMDAFTLNGNKKYSKELKQQAVLDYLAGYGSQDDICKKYGIRSKAKLQVWINRYNGHEELKSSGTGGTLIMTKGRKTTFDERIEIVQYCIAHDHNYAETAEKYQVSYQQARNYTVKYESKGVEALRDNRGKRKSLYAMNELEKLRAEVKILRAEKERAEMEVAFLKKLEEIERRRG